LSPSTNYSIGLLELETALDYSNRLSRLGALMAGVAHQLRGPLHGMSLRLELLRNDDGEGKSRHLERLRQEVERLDHAVEALLRFLRPEELKLTDFDLNQFMRELGTRVASERIQVEYRLDETLPMVQADRTMLGEAFANLITNAVQAMPDGGVIVLQSVHSDGGVEATISDSGVGIEKEKLEHVFDLYYTTKPAGGGLGLSLALRAVELNRGRLTIESQEGKGTICKVRLPIVDATATLQGAPTDAV
jgi:signal transduction histidine kinase